MQHLISNLGWALIHFLWQGTLITFAYWVISRNVNSIHAKYWTGMGMVLLALFTPIINALNYSSGSISTASVTTLETVIISHQQLGVESLLMFLVNQSLPYFVLLWAATVVFLSVRLIRSWMQLAAIRHDCDPRLSNELKQYIKNIAIKLDLPVIPALKVSQQVLVPAAYGIFKPTVLLPLSLISQIPREQLLAIIKHELCHLKRNDFIHNIIQLCADILLFFHPGIRWMNNDIRHTREQCCDQMVLSNDTETITYAKALTSIAEFTNGLKFRHSVHLGINDGVLLNRVKFLLQNKSSQSSLMIFAPLLLLILFSFMLLQPSLNSNNDFTDTPDAFTSPSGQRILAYSTDESQPKSILKKHIFYPKFDTSVTTPSTTANKIESIVSKESNTINYKLLTETTKSIGNLVEPAQNSIALPKINDTFSSIEPYTYDEPFQNLKYDSDLSQSTIDTNNYNTKENELTTARKNQNIESKMLVSFDEFSKNSITPKFKRYVAPTYPQRFWRNQVEQEVIATFKISSDGKAYDIDFGSQNSNYVAFEQEVEKAMKSWRFDTASLNGSTLQQTYQQIFSFSLSDELEKNCEIARTGAHLTKPMPCNK